MENNDGGDPDQTEPCFSFLFYTDDGDGNGRTSEKAASQIQPPEMNFAASSVTDGEGV